METKLIKGVRTTREAAVLENIRLVWKVAHKYKRKAKASGIEFEELENIGVIGLLKAFDAFEDDKGFQFSTFATHKIFGEISRAIQNAADKGVRYPVSVKDLAARIVRHRLINEPVPYIAKQLKETEFKAQSALDYINEKSALSLDKEQIIQKELDPVTYYDILGKEADLSTVVVQDFMAHLTPRERDAVTRTMEGANQTEIAAVWGMSRTSVANYLKRAQEKLQRYTSEQHLII